MVQRIALPALSALLLCCGAGAGRADSPVTDPASTCADGTTSAKAGPVACAGHGGPARPVTNAPQTDTQPAGALSDSSQAVTRGEPRGSAVLAPAWASARCGDGTFTRSKSHARACAKHGGVAAWLTSGGPSS